jgi:hypothetical protein
MPDTEKVSNSYYVQAGCHSCLYVHLQQHQEQGPQYFCMRDAVPPPHYNGRYDEEKEDRYQAEREDWETGREVAAQGCCDCFTPARAIRKLAAPIKEGPVASPVACHAQNVLILAVLVIFVIFVLFFSN